MRKSVDWAAHIQHRLKHLHSNLNQDHYWYYGQHFILWGVEGSNFFYLKPLKARICKNSFEFWISRLLALGAQRFLQSHQFRESWLIRLQKLLEHWNQILFWHFGALGGLKSKKLLPSTKHKIKFCASWQFFGFLMAKYFYPLFAPPLSVLLKMAMTLYMVTRQIDY